MNGLPFPAPQSRLGRRLSKTVSLADSREEGLWDGDHILTLKFSSNSCADCVEFDV